MKRDRLYFQDKKNSRWLDEQMFETLFNRYWENMFGFCRRHIGDTEYSREIVQDVFMSLWDRRDQLDIQVNIGHYLFSAVRLKIAKYFREESYRENKLLTVRETFHDRTNNTEESIYYHDLKAQLDLLLLKLPERCRDVYKLSRNEGLSISEIASTLSIAEKTAEAHLTKALKFLSAGIRSLEVR
jgi:RNA polymerase sigma-70 factor (family 1)